MCLKKKIHIKDILNDFNDVSVIGNKDLYFDNISNIEDSNNTSLIWIKPNLPDILVEKYLIKSKARIVVCDSATSIFKSNEKTYIVNNNPKFLFSSIIKRYFSQERENGVHITSVVDKDVIIPNSSYIGPYCIIEKCNIGENVRIEGYTIIKNNVNISNNVEIGSHCNIGSDGFGYSRDVNNNLCHFPHLGGVVIEENVTIGAHSSIDRGTLNNTLICSGVKMDDYCNIAHNVQIGKDSLIVANTSIAGSAIIGENCQLWMNCVIKNGIKLGDNVNVGMGSVVTRSYKSGANLFGNPAKKI